MTQSRPQPQTGILDIAAYVAGASKAEGANQITKLSSNENPAGPSPCAIAAFKDCADSLALYPSPDHAELRAAIAEVHGLDPARIVCGAGSDELIALLCSAYAGPGDEVLYSAHGFAMYPISARAAGATPVTAPETDRTASVDALLAAVTACTKLVFLANPNNPTGTMIPDAEVTRLADHVPDTCLLVLDGAYVEYLDDHDGGAALAQTRKNVVMTRTFSKIFGLGGLRVGWAYGPEHVIDVLNRVRGPFNVSAAGLAAAEAAIRDIDYVRTCRAANAHWRDWMVSELNALGLPTDASYANFVLPRFSSPKAASGCDTHLRANGFIVRKVDGYGLPEYLRITIGDEVACRRVIGLISEFLGQA
ncbi:histidinol-phosphate transaminase [Halovulum sp. GXIMD14793]